MSTLKTGTYAPDFTLPDQNGKAVSLSQYRGAPVLLYFYPKAMTPRCSVQACGLRDSRDDLGIPVLGISPDSPERLKKFEQKYTLNFKLLADAEKLVAKLYGVWQLKKFMGKGYMGIVRTSFIIGDNGILLAVLNRFKAKTHHQDVLAKCRQLFDQTP